MPGSLHRLFYIATAVPLLLAIIGIIMMLLASPGYRLDWWEFRSGFTLLRWGASLNALAAVLAGAALIAMLAWHRRRRRIILAGLVMIVGIVAAAIPWSWQQRAASVPPIHDITTDTDNPPAFVAIAPLRRDAPNPVEYAGRETARAQHEAYPDIRPMYFDAKPVEVFRAAKQAISELGWQLVEADENDGRIEAVDTTRWFGFRDDIVIRIRADNGGTRMDVRSKSRVGRSDVGTNTRRIRAFRDTMQARLPARADTNKPDTTG
ncbi:MAG: DUF1499 domain-containing protein [Gammaproteobacteria bacterium]|nr:DUF1499 domain-containing protein [Gammaproteobacteria bacterium]